MKNNELLPKELILKSLTGKAVVKQDVYAYTSKVFRELQMQLEKKIKFLSDALKKVDDRIEIACNLGSAHKAEVQLAGDRLIFQMHTNVFKIDEASSLWKTDYLRKDAFKGYCGIINIYNFLNDSFLFNRFNDSGYLIARIFVNAEGHFFVQGKRQLGFLYNDFVNNILTPEALSDVLESAMLYALNFDLLTPPYNKVSEVTVHEMQNLTDSIHLKTGKRLGFRFQADLIDPDEEE